MKRTCWQWEFQWIESTNWAFRMQSADPRFYTET